MLRIKRKKLFWSVIGFVVFLVGLVAGSFLVLRSETSEGALFDLENPSDSSAAIDSSGFIEDLKKFQEQNPVVSGDNLTAKFLAALAQAGVGQEVSSGEATSPEFLYGTVFPYLADLNQNLFPEIPQSAVRVSVKADPATYLVEAKTAVILLAGAWQEAFRYSSQELEGPSIKEKLDEIEELLGVVDEELRERDVPLEHRTLHRKLLQLSSDVGLIVRAGIVHRQDDPIKALLVMDRVEDVIVSGQTLLFEIIQAEKQRL